MAVEQKITVYNITSSDVTVMPHESQTILTVGQVTSSVLLWMLCFALLQAGVRIVYIRSILWIQNTM